MIKLCRNRFFLSSSVEYLGLKNDESFKRLKTFNSNLDYALFLEK